MRPAVYFRQKPSHGGGAGRSAACAMYARVGGPERLTIRNGPTDRFYSVRVSGSRRPRTLRMGRAIHLCVPVISLLVRFLACWPAGRGVRCAAVSLGLGTADERGQTPATRLPLSICVPQRLSAVPSSSRGGCVPRPPPIYQEPKARSKGTQKIAYGSELFFTWLHLHYSGGAVGGSCGIWVVCVFCWVLSCPPYARHGSSHPSSTATVRTPSPEVLVRRPRPARHPPRCLPRRPRCPSARPPRGGVPGTRPSRVDRGERARHQHGA